MGNFTFAFFEKKFLKGDVVLDTREGYIFVFVLKAMEILIQNRDVNKYLWEIYLMDTIR